MAIVDEPINVTLGTYLSVRVFAFRDPVGRAGRAEILPVGLIDRRSRHVYLVVAHDWSGVIIALFVALPTILFAVACSRRA